MSEDNLLEQQEELEALQAIYEEDLILQQELPYQMQLVLPVDIPEGSITLNVCYTSKETPDQIEIMGNYNLQFLPPITLSLTLPPNYPSDEPPQFTITSEWLTKEHLSTICKEFDQLCESNIGFPMIFTLSNWITSDCIPFLFPTNEINLLSKSEQDNIRFPEPRAVPQCNNIQDTTMSLLQHNKQEQMALFRQNEHMCNLCFEEKKGTLFTFLSCCGTSFCSECVERMVNTLVANGSFDLLKCPSCEEEFHPSFLKIYLNEEQMERWERLTLKRTLESMDDVRYCPRCESVVIIEDNKFAQCPNCTYAFCSRCLGDYHNDSTCDEMAVLMKQIRQSKDAKNELKSLQAIRKQAKKCPSCNIFISRTHGCNKMVCSQCGKFFCYSCGQAIKGYDHFNTTGGRGCKVFDDVTNDMIHFYAQLQQNQWNGEFAEGEGVPAWAHLQRKRCPHCGLENYKQARNNDIRCYHCAKHFCFLCKAKIKGTVHFMTTDCIQHSD